MPHNTNQAELDNNQIREKLAPFGNAAQIVGTKRVELYDVVRSLLAAEIKAAELRVIETVATDEGWEQSRDHLARKFGFPDKYSHAPGKCICATALTGEQPIEAHTAKQVAAALEAVKTKVIGKNEIPQWDEESSFCDRCEFERTDDSKDCLCRIRNKLRAKQRIVLKTLQLAALTQGGHSE